MLPAGHGGGRAGRLSAGLAQFVRMTARQAPRAGLTFVFALGEHRDGNDGAQKFLRKIDARSFRQDPCAPE
jgi:hypothetical protein